MEAPLHLLERGTGTTNGSQEKGPEAKQQKSRDLAKVMVLLERCIDFESKNKKKLKKSLEKARNYTKKYGCP